MHLDEEANTIQETKHPQQHGKYVTLRKFFYEHSISYSASLRNHPTQLTWLFLDGWVLVPWEKQCKSLENMDYITFPVWLEIVKKPKTNLLPEDEQN